MVSRNTSRNGRCSGVGFQLPAASAQWQRPRFVTRHGPPPSHSVYRDRGSAPWTLTSRVSRSVTSGHAWAPPLPARSVRRLRRAISQRHCPPPPPSRSARWPSLVARCPARPPTRTATPCSTRATTGWACLSHIPIPLTFRPSRIRRPCPPSPSPISRDPRRAHYVGARYCTKAFTTFSR